MNSTLSRTSTVIMIVCGLGLLVCHFVPLWAIYLEAPQYPEGLSMFLYTNKISGDYKIINGLNHYIGMKEIHQKDFWEFRVLPYILGLFSMIAFFIAWHRKKIGLYLFCILFLLFGIGFMIDFYFWEYDYGHNLNPNAAIVVPGMTYQPPLIGFKQLLNFGAYSCPDIGGWIMFGVGVLLLIVSIYELKKSKL
ncbi:hypothetical protein [Riemerella columbipharyngis]|uniref:Copper chaperone NosL n=1 Tax=Riemerella columbipharyngis TaxID=1071918 RepID=A0A1G7C6L9_9FLAO|nr:hypothetical protein [Riemerella columbipharyngis]SDE34958.1 hypothetical protein SAMN05421544_10771 [Riemerella columbipharyngis]